MINYIKLGLVLALLSAFGYIAWDYQATKTENKRLTNELKAANDTVAALDNVVKRNNEIRQRTDNLVDEIDKEPEKNDADTAPVLLNAIGRLR